MIKLLDEKTLTDIYENAMKEAFPPEELKPLKNMLMMQQDGQYDVWGYYPNGELVAYACVCTHQTPVLLDYYAVVKEYRGNGVGTAFLRQLLNEQNRYDSMMIEVEAIASAINDKDRIKRERRMAFYERLGFSRTITEANVFGVHYWVLTNADSHSVSESMASVYHYFVDKPEMYEKNIEIWDAE